MLAVPLTDRQMRAVLEASQPLDSVKRGILLERVAAQLRFQCGGRLADDDVQAALKSALRGLQQDSARA